VTVLDTSVVVDYLLGLESASTVSGFLSPLVPAAAPDVLVFEILAVLRRELLREAVEEARARQAVGDLGDLAIELFPSLSLRHRAFALHDNITAGDGLFVALAESLGEPLVTKDRALARAARKHTGVEVLLLA
jgi:predicted nucleic acid-binding protein